MIIDDLFDRVGSSTARVIGAAVIALIALPTLAILLGTEWPRLELGAFALLAWMALIAAISAPAVVCIAVLFALYFTTRAPSQAHKRLAWLEASTSVAWLRLILAVAAMTRPVLVVPWLLCEALPICWTMHRLQLASNGDNTRIEDAAIALGAEVRLGRMLAIWLSLRLRVRDICLLAFAQIFGSLAALPLVVEVLTPAAQQNALQPLLTDPLLLDTFISDTILVPPLHLFIVLITVLFCRLVAARLVRETLT